MPTRDSRLATFAIVAVCLEKLEDFPAEVMVTQWALESAWGAKPTGGYNTFGIKYVECQHDGFHWATTTEHVDEKGLAWLQGLQDRGLIKNLTFIRHLSNGRNVYAMEDRFASFDSPLDAARGYVKFLRDNPRYHPILSRYAVKRDPEELLAGIVLAGYATGDGYTNLATRILRQSNIQNAVAAARKLEDPCALATKR